MHDKCDVMVELNMFHLCIGSSFQFNIIMRIRLFNEMTGKCQLMLEGCKLTYYLSTTNHLRSQQSLCNCVCTEFRTR